MNRASSLIRVLTALLLAGTALLARPATAPQPAAASSPTVADAASLQSFFRHADIDEVRLSPSGHWLAITTGAPSGRRVLAVVDLEGKTPPTLAANYVDADVRSFDWVNDDRLVYNLIDLEEGGGTQGFGPGLVSTRRDGSETRQLIEWHHAFVAERRGPGTPPLPYNHELLSVPAGSGNEVIVGRYQLDQQGDVTAVLPSRLDVTTGRLVNLAAGAPDHATRWWFDAAGEPRVVETLFHGQVQYWWRGSADSMWRSIGQFAVHEVGFEPSFVDAGRTLFVTAPSARGEAVLKRFDFAKMQPETEPIVSTPGFDFTGHLLTDSARAAAFGVSVETDARSTIWFGPQMQAIQKRVDARLPGRINEIDCHRCNDPDILLVHSYSDQDPGSYWIFRPQSDTWQPVGEVRKGIDPRASAQVDFRRIKARDGQDLPVWITAQPVARGSAPRPAVVLVHGGPWVRGNHWGWNSEAQFLASRGYVVIEPEFRGSTGYSEPHFRSGWKQWGATMQDDVTDATRWAVGEGLADVRRICIAGASYGGYATLMGLIREPDLYRCGVAWVGVSDPRLMFQSTWASDMSAEGRRFFLPDLLGDPQKDAAMLARVAPVERAAEIRAPLLLAYGGQDRRVPPEHGRKLRTALQSAGHEPEWVVYGDEGHGWLRTANQVDFWARVERFLDTNLK